jgi:hypothetical protein
MLETLLVFEKTRSFSGKIGQSGHIVGSDHCIPKMLPRASPPILPARLPKNAADYSAMENAIDPMSVFKTLTPRFFSR